MAAKKLMAFLNIAAFLPKYLISRGSVTTPTIIKVVMNTAITAYDAPFEIRDAAIGYETNPGIRVTEPIIAAIKNPDTPEPGPIYSSMMSCGIKKSSMLIKTSIFMNDGAMPKNIATPFFKAALVLFLSRINDASNEIAATDAKIRALLTINSTRPKAAFQGCS
jgi:hypothetical protein